MSTGVPGGPAEERLARRLDRLSPERHPFVHRSAGMLHALGRLDLAAYTAVARMSTPGRRRGTSR